MPVVRRRAHGLSTVPPLPRAQNLATRAAAASRRPRGRQLGPRRGSLVLELEERAAHGRHSRSRLLGEPRAPTPVAERQLGRHAAHRDRMLRGRRSGLQQGDDHRCYRPPGQTTGRSGPPRSSTAIGVTGEAVVRRRIVVERCVTAVGAAGSGFRGRAGVQGARCHQWARPRRRHR